uniref:Exonuclease domain-containing protein n=1 Tax=Aegilops tauschii subsp. strangulata TaxID=200361 RepID=A0A453FAS5_AEGTS
PRAITKERIRFRLERCFLRWYLKKTISSRTVFPESANCFPRAITQTLVFARAPGSPDLEFARRSGARILTKMSPIMAARGQGLGQGQGHQVQQDFDFFLVVDFEATCEKDARIYPQEISSSSRPCSSTAPPASSHPRSAGGRRRRRGSRRGALATR